MQAVSLACNQLISPSGFLAAAVRGKRGCAVSWNLEPITP